MIIVKLWGGLGNQLFQYAYGYQLAEKLKTGLKLDISFYEKQNLRKPIILEFNLKFPETLSKKNLSPMTNFFNTKNVNRIIRIPSTFCLPIEDGFKYLKETRHYYKEELKVYNRNNVYIDGYWQCPLYFENMRSELISQFELKRSISLKMQGFITKFEKENSIAIHVRRGDYVNNKNPFSKLVLISKEYYDEAIKRAYEKIPNPHFYFFTNDVKWVKENYKNLPNSHIISDDISCEDFEELILISRCKHQIISNSTFSWWGAWLNSNIDKSVWAPEQGFGNNDILPTEWCKIPI
ncbi:alpha-1,2-fucosyltransferase [Planococcus sp. ANT_H30]|uniref:alpha-1,2-fucosyltransferase n=1 Tax=Planococcus sp. ANT_H30 TaxID=2597347 RepID=UPI00165EA5FA|nr:alpha-1,2-fucosyltransferase [Planococcus sp. ANT_H30]